ncbi:MAG TPA: hypothetical protein DHN33_03075, partial [Eubacteriaceae bacterium]|nr:hypothetical protein [Eubacteriaceae bacterium]
FKYALEKGYPMVKGCWWQDPDEVREIFQKNGFDIRNLEKEGLFHLHNFSASYEKNGIVGP